MSKVVVIGIDGMDYQVMNDMLSMLPNLHALSSNGTSAQLHSVFPADSIPAWISIYTGVGPETHGIVRSIDYLNKNYKKFSIDTSAFRGKTFWDVASNNGKKVCIINPFMAYPVWPVNGTFISGPVFTSGEAQCYPDEINRKYGLPEILGGIVDFPTTKTMDDFIVKCRADTTELAEYSLKLFSGEKCDLFFASFFTLDRLQHFLWRFADKNDPTYPGANKYQDVIADFYRLFDDIIGKFKAAMNKEDQLLIISDHGHGMRCTQHLNLNEYLRKKGYLTSSGGRRPFLNKKYWVEKAKQWVLQALFSANLEDWTYLIARFVPNRQKLKTADFAIDGFGSIARVSEFAGSGPYGGIEINVKIKDSDDYKETIQSIMNDLLSLNEQFEHRLFKWIKPVEEMYPLILKNNVYPDIIFELYPPYGINWDIYAPLVRRNPFHKKISGGHNSEGVILFNTPHLRGREGYSVLDVKQLILDNLDIHVN